MSPSLLLFISAFFHALWNALVKRSEHKEQALFWVSLIAVLVALSTNLIFTEVTLGTGPGPWYSVIAGLFEGAYLVSLAQTLRLLPLGLSYAIMRGFAMLVVWGIAGGLLAEPFTQNTALGVLLVFGGLCLMPHPREGAEAKRVPRRHLIWPYLTGAFIAGYHLSYGGALKHGANPFTLFSLGLFVALPILLAFRSRDLPVSYVAAAKQDFPRLAIAGLASAASFTIFLMGLQESGAGFGITLRNTSIVFAQFFGLLLNEKIAPQQWLGIVAILGGAALI